MRRQRNHPRLAPSETRRHVARVHHDRSVAHHQVVVHRLVIGDDDDGGGFRNDAFGEGDAGAYCAVLPEGRDVGIVLAHFGALLLEEADDIERRTLAHVVYVALVGDAEHQHPAALH